MKKLPALADLEARRPSAGPNIDALDGVRGIAVLLVVASHNAGLGLAHQGMVGVSLFFCLSAFLLTLPIARDPGLLARPSALSRYAKRRVARIVPLYYLVLITWYGLAQWRPLLLWLHLSFQKGALHFWTIPQELFFYLLLPLLGLLHPFVFRRRTGPMLLALAALATLANWLLDPYQFALGIFLVGMIFAYLVHWEPVERWLQRPQIRGALNFAAWAVLASFVLTAPVVLRMLGGPAIDPERIPVRRWPGTFAVSCSVLILAAYTCRGGALQRLLCWRPLRLLGIVSYSVYLISPFVTYTLYYLAPGLQHGNWLFALAMTGSMAVSLLTYSFVERPFITIKAPARAA